MSDLSDSIANINGEHREALMWFKDKAGEVVPWKEIAKHAETGPRLANLAKGIYKPAYMDLALSVKQLITSPYADSQTDFRPDGSWSSLYFQEGHNPQDRDLHATNRGLVKCMEQAVPVGVLYQTASGRGAEYRVLGLARVVDWEDGFFALEGYSVDGDLKLRQHTSGPAEILTRERAKIDAQGDFRLDEIEDVRKRAIAQVVVRRGQAGFRDALLEAYRGKCAITGCDAVEALEAAHITPYLGQTSNNAQNGILLRADIHTLFDLGLLVIDPETFLVKVSVRLKNSVYGDLDGKAIWLPEDQNAHPSAEALKSHTQWASI